MRPPESFSSAAPKFLAKVSGTSLMVGVEIFMTNVCAGAAPDHSARAQTPAAAAAVCIKAVARRMSFSLPVAGRFFWARFVGGLAALPARTLEDRRRPDNGNLARCGEPT